MTVEFEKKVMREGIVDTKKYRYVVKECHDSNSQWAEIRRLPIEKLDTISAAGEWETVKAIK